MRKIFLLLFLFVSPSLQFLGNDIFSSGDERLFEIFCVQNEEELAAIGKTTWYIFSYFEGL
jgi:hypothetical protein